VTAADAPVKDLARNRQASHLYLLLDKFEAGIVLLGPEVKSIRAGQIQLREAFVQVQQGELWLVNCHVTPWAQHTHLTLTPLDPLRRRKLLLHGDEIAKLDGKVREKGLTLIPLRVYLKRGKVKLELALAKGKTGVDKRDALREKDLDREAARELRER
jgi:SsrA-binding protein